MQIRKLCQVCETEPGYSSCRSCGRLMGENCKKETMCKDCTFGIMSKKR